MAMKIVPLQIANQNMMEAVGKQRTSQQPLYKKRDPMKMVQGPLVEEVMDCMICSICKRFPVQQLFSCKGGHSLCLECVKTEETQGVVPVQCPAMKSLGLEGVRCGKNVTKVLPGGLWKLYLNSTFSCPNLGCDVTLSGRDIGVHTEHCRYCVTIICQVTSCPVKDDLPLPLYLKHMLEVHHVKIVRSTNPTKCQVVLPPRREPAIPNVWICTILEDFSNHFIICVKEDEKDFNFYCFVLEGADNTAASYRIRIEVSEGINHESWGIRWIGNILSVTKSIVAAEASGSFFSLNKDVVFQNLLFDREFWSMDIWIHKVEQHESNPSKTKKLDRALCYTSKFRFPCLKKSCRQFVPPVAGHSRGSARGSEVQNKFSVEDLPSSSYEDEVDK